MPSETHGVDEQTRKLPLRLSATSRAFARAWCGKSVPADSFALPHTRPTCWQCAQIFDREARKEEPTKPWKPGEPMNVHQCAAILLALTCQGCDGRKLAKMAFCRHCYGRLTSDLKVALYRRHGQGFEQAYEKSLALLRGVSR